MPTRSPVIAGVEPIKITLPRPALTIDGRTACATYADSRWSTSRGPRNSAVVKDVKSLIHSSPQNGCLATQSDTRHYIRPTGTASTRRVINPRGLAYVPRKADEIGTRARVHGEFDGHAGWPLHRLQGRAAIDRHRAVPGWRDDGWMETLVRRMGG